MARRPYQPDKNGANAHPSNRQRRVGFDQQLQPLYGALTSDVLLEGAARARELDQKTNFSGVTNSNTERGVVTDDTGDALTTALGVLDGVTAAWRWDGFALQLPTALKTGVDVLADVVGTIRTLLEAVLAILKIVEAASLINLDALSIIVNVLKSQIEDILSLFTGGTGVYGINIPLQAPPGKDSAARVAALQATTVNLRTAVAKGLGIDVSHNTKAGKINNRILSDVLPIAAVHPARQGGMDGFIETFEKSLDDELDLERPQLGSNAWVGGVVIVYGGTDLGLLQQQWRGLLGLFGGFVGDNKGLELPPAPTGVSAESLVSISGAPKVAVRWDRPKVKFKLTGYYPAWNPLRDVLYVAADLDTISPKSKSWTDDIANYNELVNLNRPVAAYARTTVATSAWSKTYIDEAYTAEDAGKTYVYRVGRVYEKQMSATLTSSFEVEVLSAPFKLRLPHEKGSVSAGVAPNWVSGRVSDFLPPALVALLDELRVVLNQLLDLPVDFTGVLTDVVQSMVAEVEKWVALARRLDALLQMVKGLFDISAGFHALSFFGLGGNEFMKSVLRDSVANAPTPNEEDTTPDEDDPSLSESLQARLEKTSFTDFLADNKVPKFDGDDTVGGMAFVAGDQSMQAALATYRLFQTLFGVGDNSKTTPERQYDIDVALGGGGDGRPAPIFGDDFSAGGAATAAGTSGSTFGEDLGLVTSHDEEGGAC